MQEISIQSPLLHTLHYPLYPLFASGGHIINSCCRQWDVALQALFGHQNWLHCWPLIALPSNFKQLEVDSVRWRRFHSGHCGAGWSAVREDGGIVSWRCGLLNGIVGHKHNKIWWLGYGCLSSLSIQPFLWALRCNNQPLMMWEYSQQDDTVIVVVF